MRAVAGGVDDRPLPYTLRSSGQWQSTASERKNDCGIIEAAGLRDRHFWEMASRIDRRYGTHRAWLRSLLRLPLRMCRLLLAPVLLGRAQAGQLSRPVSQSH